MDSDYISEGLSNVKNEGKEERKRDSWLFCFSPWLDGGIIYLDGGNPGAGMEEQESGAKISISVT